MLRSTLLDVRGNVRGPAHSGAACILLGAMSQSLPPHPSTIVADRTGAVVDIAQHVVGEDPPTPFRDSVPCTPTFCWHDL